jgi:hypothetical protein
MAFFRRPREGSSWDWHSPVFYEQPSGLQSDRGATFPGVLLAKPRNTARLRSFRPPAWMRRIGGRVRPKDQSKLIQAHVESRRPPVNAHHSCRPPGRTIVAGGAARLGEPATGERPKDLSSALPPRPAEGGSLQGALAKVIRPPPGGKTKTPRDHRCRQPVVCSPKAARSATGNRRAE